MKKLFILLLCILTIGRIYAKEYKVFDMTIDLDDSYHILTRDNYKGNELLEALGTNDKEFEEYFKEMNMYIDALKIEKDIVVDELVISYEKNDEIKNLSNYDKEYIEGQAKLLSITLKSNSKIYDDGMYETGPYKYMYHHYMQDDKYNYFYQTVVNGNSYLLFLSSMNKIDDQSIESFRKNIVDKVVYDMDETLVEDDYEEENHHNSFFDYIDDNVVQIVTLSITFGIISFIANKRKDKKDFKGKDDDFWNDNKAQ